MTPPTRIAATDRLSRMHMPDRAEQIGVSVREADISLRLDGGDHGLLDTTHVDTVRFPPPSWALEEFAAAAADGSLAYTSYRGNPDVLKVVSHAVGGLLGVDVEPTEHLALTPGTQSGLFAVLSALVDDDDLVLVADPDYLFNERILAFLGARIERIGVIAEGETARLDVDAIARAGARNPKLLLFTHPSNPTGAVYDADTMRQIAQLAADGDFRVVVDQLYCRLLYDDVPYTHLIARPGMRERCVTLLGPSKTESMSGFRVGVVVGPADVLDAVEQTLAVTSLRAPAYAQHVLRRWLVDDHDFLQTRIAELQALRNATVARLRTVPYLRVDTPPATAYLFPDVSALGLPDQDVAAILQREAGVIVSPGYQFGPAGVGRFRICYARDEQQWDAALDRMVPVLNTLGRDRGVM